MYAPTVEVDKDHKVIFNFNQKFHFPARGRVKSLKEPYQTPPPPPGNDSWFRACTEYLESVTGVTLSGLVDYDYGSCETGSMFKHRKSLFHQVFFSDGHAMGARHTVSERMGCAGLLEVR